MGVALLHGVVSQKATILGNKTGVNNSDLRFLNAPNWLYDGTVNFGPAVIGTATYFDNITYPSTWPPTNTPLVDVNILNINLSAPTIPDSQFSQANPVAAPNLIRLYSA